MMRSIVGWSQKFKLLVVALAAAMMLVGVTQLRNMPVDVVPEFVPPYVEVQTEALGLSAQEVEQLITVPLEADLLAGVAFLDTIQSESVAGLSSVVMVFEPGTDIFRARQVVAERLTQAHALPHVSKPPEMLQPLSTTSRVMMVALSSRDLSLIDMSVLARWTIRPRLMGVEGVANVAIWGQRERQLQVLVDPRRLRQAGVSLEHIIKAAGNALWVSPLSFLEASTPGTGGFIETANQRIGIQHILPITSAEDLGRVVIELEDDTAAPVRLGDVATVVEDHQPLIGDAIVNDGSGVLLVIEKFPGANTLEVTRGVEEALDALRPGMTGIEFDSTIYRPATFIESGISNIMLALLFGFILVAIVLAGLLFDWRAALIAVVAIPLSFVAAALALYALGATLNAMILAGLVIAIGVVVDDAIVGTESVIGRLRHRREQDADKSTAEIVLESTVEARRAIVYATLIILAALVPAFFIGGPTGAFLPQIGLAYVVAVIASMLVALTVTPALGLILLSRGPGEGRQSPLVPRLRSAYEGALSRLIERPRRGIAVVGVVVLAGLLVVPFTAQSLVPTFRDRDLLIHWDSTPGTSQPEMSRIVAQASGELRAVPGVRNVGAHVGRAIVSDQVVGINSGELWVSIDPAADYDRTVAAVQEVIDGYPGLGGDLLTYPAERIGQVLTNGDEDILVRVYGEDLSVLGAKADELRSAIAPIGGVVSATVDVPAQEPTLEVEVDLAAAERHGIKAGDVRRAAAVLLSGLVVGSLFEDQKIFEVVVWGAPEIRRSVSDIRGLLIETPGGDHVRLDEVADLRIVPSPNVIRREGVSRRIDVAVDVDGRDIASVARDIDSRIKAVEFPLEHHAEVLGGYAERQAAQDRLTAMAIAAAIVVFLLLQAAFGSWRLAILIFVTLPFALIGGLLAAFATGGVLSLGSLVGFFTLLGLAARNGMMLMNHFQRLQRENGEQFGPGLILRGASERLAPMLTTTAATAVAVAPFAILGSLPGYEIVSPMAVVILGGLVTSTLLNLFIVPALYLASRPSAEPDTSTAQLIEQPGLSPA